MCCVWCTRLQQAHGASTPAVALLRRGILSPPPPPQPPLLPTRCPLLCPLPWLLWVWIAVEVVSLLVAAWACFNALLTTAAWSMPAQNGWREIASVATADGFGAVAGGAAGSEATPAPTLIPALLPSATRSPQSMIFEMLRLCLLSCTHFRPLRQSLSPAGNGWGPFARTAANKPSQFPAAVPSPILSESPVPLATREVPALALPVDMFLGGELEKGMWAPPAVAGVAAGLAAGVPGSLNISSRSLEWYPWNLVPWSLSCAHCSAAILSSRWRSLDKVSFRCWRIV